MIQALYSLPEAAALIGTTPATLRNEIRRGAIRARKIGRDWVMTSVEVARHRQEREWRRERRERKEPA